MDYILFAGMIMCHWMHAVENVEHYYERIKQFQSLSLWFILWKLKIKFISTNMMWRYLCWRFKRLLCNWIEIVYYIFKRFREFIGVPQLHSISKYKRRFDFKWKRIWITMVLEELIMLLLEHVYSNRQQMLFWLSAFYFEVLKCTP